MLILSSLHLNKHSNFNTALVVLNKLSNIILLSIIIPLLNLIFKNKFFSLKSTNFLTFQLNPTNIESTVNKSVGINNDQKTTSMQSNKDINYINPNVQVGEPNIETIDSTIISTVGEFLNYYAPYFIISCSGLILIGNIYLALKSPANPGNVAGVGGAVNDAVASAVASAVQAGQEEIAVAAAKAISKEMLEAMLPAEFRVFCDSYKALVEAFMLLSSRVDCIEDALKNVWR